MADFMFQNMAYRATVYRTGITTWYQWQEGAEGKKNTKYEKTCLGLRIVF